MICQDDRIVFQLQPEFEKISPEHSATRGLALLEKFLNSVEAKGESKWGMGFIEMLICERY